MPTSFSDAVAFIEEGDVASLARCLSEHPTLASAGGDSGDTLLHHACHHKLEEAVALLLDAGASPHARGFHGRTPLHSAVTDSSASRAAPIVSRLLAAGADPGARDDAGADVVTLARQEVWAPQDEVLDLFGARPAARPDTSSFEATRATIRSIERRAHTELAVSQLLEAWVSGAAAPTDGLTPQADQGLLQELHELLEHVGRTRWRAPVAEFIRRAAKPAQLREFLSALDED